MRHGVKEETSLTPISYKPHEINGNATSRLTPSCPWFTRKLAHLFSLIAVPRGGQTPGPHELKPPVLSEQGFVSKPSTPQAESNHAPVPLTFL